MSGVYYFTGLYSNTVIPINLYFYFETFDDDDYCKLEDKRPIVRFLLALAEGLLVRNVSLDGRGVKGGPFGPISKNLVAGRML